MPHSESRIRPVFHCSRCCKRVDPKEANVIFQPKRDRSVEKVLATYCWPCDIATGRRKPWMRLASFLAGTK